MNFDPNYIFITHSALFTHSSAKINMAESPAVKIGDNVELIGGEISKNIDH